jgi:predicted DNA-binding transcriptional regulator AlpA
MVIEMGNIERKYLDAEAAAIHLNLSKSTLAKLRLTGVGPRFYKLGRRVVYSLEDLTDWVKSMSAINAYGPV